MRGLWSSVWRGVWLRVWTSEWSGVMAAAACTEGSVSDVWRGGGGGGGGPLRWRGWRRRREQGVGIDGKGDQYPAVVMEVAEKEVAVKSAGWKAVRQTRATRGGGI